MDINANIEADKERMETLQKNLKMHLQRISLERRSLKRDLTNYINRARNANK